MKTLLFHGYAVIFLFILQGAAYAQNIASPELVSGYKKYINTTDYAPVAANDFITVPLSQSVTGSVLANDYDPREKAISAYLVTNSPNGTVNLSEDGSFTFTPNSSFSGSSTSFSYKVCNNSLCSETATVTLTFPKNMMIPVMLTDFIANYNDKHDVVLNWTTSFENDLDRFEVERSDDGVHFTTIGTIKGNGTTNVTHHYSFNNNVSRQTVTKNDLYYRLKQVTTDNRIASSKILIVRVYKTRSLQLASVTPNPVVNDIKVSVQLNEDSYVVVKVMNKDGAEVMRKSIKSDRGMNSYTLDGTSGLAKGMYFLEMIVNSNERMLVKLLKD